MHELLKLPHAIVQKPRALVRSKQLGALGFEIAGQAGDGHLEMLDLLLRRAELGPDFRMVPVMAVTRDRIRRLLVVHRSGPRGRSCRAKEPASARYKYSPIRIGSNSANNYRKHMIARPSKTIQQSLPYYYFGVS